MKIFTLKLPNHKWYHWIIRPIKTWKAMKWLKDVELRVSEEIDTDKIHECYVNSAVYGVGYYDVTPLREEDARN